MKRWQIDGHPTDAQLDEIAAVLLNGGVVLMPTDTIYGLHALAQSSAVVRIVELKGREENKPFVTIAASVTQIEALGVHVPDEVREIWPAALTAILTRSDRTTIAIRIPDLDWLRSLLERTGPLVSTSANRSHESPITFPNQLAPELQSALDGIVDDGVRESKASAIVDFTGDAPRVIREGDFRFTQNLRKTLRKSL